MTLLITSTGARRPFGLTILSAALAAAVVPLASSRAADSPGVKLTFSVQLAAQHTVTSDPGCPLKNLIEGTGLTNLLGPVHDEQSDCIHADGTIDHGVLTLTGAALGNGLPGGEDSGDSISGQYRAHLVPTVASELTRPPGGVWMLYGEVCTWKGTGKFAGVINDCLSPARLTPVRVSVDFSTGHAAAFGTMVVRFNDAE